ncbi:hypothetical protein ccbrp13_16450 [Ktedonobacteria bacterium brp13]|nr:hypothetical protein ccbrp13_16450 [Ktedonobacteria bacterium brp13]
MWTDSSAILIMSASLMGMYSFFPFKEAHLSAYLLQGAISLRMSWVCGTNWKVGAKDDAGW